MNICFTKHADIRYTTRDAIHDAIHDTIHDAIHDATRVVQVDRERKRRCIISRLVPTDRVEKIVV